jgi:iron-sulfur cluster assembly protein
MISLTEKAALKIKEIGEGEDLPLIIRMKNLGGGCGGMISDLLFDEEKNISDLDEVIIDNIIHPTTIKIVVDQFSYQYLNFTTLDFVDSGFESGFKFLNPNIRASCGCGKSSVY